MKKIIFLCIIIFSLCGLFVFGSNFALATRGADSGSNEVKLPNPLKNIETPQQFIGKIISTVLSVVGSLALLVFIYGGLLWMTAAGNPGNVTKGKDAMLWAALGLVVIFSSYTIIKFIFSGIGA